MTTRQTAPTVASVALFLVLAAALAGWLAGRPPPPVGSSASAAKGVPHSAALESGATATAVYVGAALYTPDEALSRTMARFPAGHESGEPAVRLVSRRTYYADFLGEPLDELGLTPAEMPPDEPVWVVGVPATGLTVGDVIDVPGAGTGVIQDERAADGMFYAWDARTGAPEGSGALVRGTVSSYETIVGLESQDIAIVPPTLEIPPLQGGQR
jgi:hypothetical protein